MSLERYRDGVSGDLDAWVAFNRTEAFASPDGLKLVAPFPPTALMQNTSGLTVPQDFASHGCDILEALRKASPAPVNSFTSILDFGVGVGRLARMFKGLRGRYTGVDVDKRHVEWVSSALDHVTAVASTPRQPLPFTDNSFDCAISISVFTHMTQKDQFFYLEELSRVMRPGGLAFFTVHGERALQRAEAEQMIFQMLDVPREEIERTRRLFPNPGFSFILQHGHLTSENYDYGITFIGKDYVKREWSRYFEVVDPGNVAIHDFQEIVVLRAR